MSNPKMKILFLASNPSKTQRLGLDEEIRAIDKQLESSQYGREIELISAWAVRPDDLLHELNEHKPTVVHFSGHGSNMGGIILADNLGNPLSVSESALESLFLVFKDNVRLVVLNACYSKRQASAIANVVDCVIGMNTIIPDEVAITFAAQFYSALGFGRSVKESFDQGIVGIKLKHSDYGGELGRTLDIQGGNSTLAAGIPELVCRDSINPMSVKLVFHRAGMSVFRLGGMSASEASLYTQVPS